MKNAPPIALLSPLVFLGVMLLSTSARLAGPSSSSSASAPAPATSASASAAGSAKVTHAPEALPLDSMTIPTTASPVPKLAEWGDATLVELTRRGSNAAGCRAYLLREWLKVKCDMHVGGMIEHAGSREGVYFWAADHMWSDWRNTNGGEVMLQLKAGDRRVVQFYQLVPNMCEGMDVGPSLMLDETWIEGEKGPTVVLR